MALRAAIEYFNDSNDGSTIRNLTVLAGLEILKFFHLPSLYQVTPVDNDILLRVNITESSLNGDMYRLINSNPPDKGIMSPQLQNILLEMRQQKWCIFYFNRLDFGSLPCDEDEIDDFCIISTTHTNVQKFKLVKGYGAFETWVINMWTINGESDSE